MEKSSQPLAYILIQTAMAVAEAGSPVGGAKKLGVSVTTVYRHLEMLEQSLEVQVFDRHHKGWTIRKDASVLLASGKEIERLLWQTRNDIQEAAGIRSRNLRIAISEDLASHYIVPLLDDFCRANNGIQPDLIIGSDFADLVQGEADVAIRPHMDPGDILVGRRVCHMTHAFYASHDYCKQMGSISTLAELKKQTICGYGDLLKDYTAAQWMDDHIDQDDIAMRFGCTSAMIRAVTEGIGLGLLPCFVGDSISSLKSVMTVENGLRVDIWLVTAAANKKRPAVRAFFKFFGSAFRADKKRFIGSALPLDPLVLYFFQLNQSAAKIFGVQEQDGFAVGSRFYFAKRACAILF